jgi:hypothetical protein
LNGEGAVESPFPPVTDDDLDRLHGQADAAGWIDLRDVTCSGRPKGFAPYKPHAQNRVTAKRILDEFELMREKEALPMGPRQAAYRLKERYVGEYTKDDFPNLGEMVKRLQQSGDLDVDSVADASAISRLPGGWVSASAFLGDAADLYRRVRTLGQPIVVEMYAEARETLPLIARVANERGVGVYSGGGSCGPNLAHGVASRALRRAVDSGQSTVVFGLADFDQAGLKNVLRPHVQHLAAFVYGTDANEHVLGAADADGVVRTMDDFDATVSFQHLALTPEMARDIVETDADRDRIDQYIASGSSVFDRDPDLLAGIQKVELEAIDPVELRELVVRAIDSVIDTTALNAVIEKEKAERNNFRPALEALADEIRGPR